MRHACTTFSVSERLGPQVASDSASPKRYAPPPPSASLRTAFLDGAQRSGDPSSRGCSLDSGVPARHGSKNSRSDPPPDDITSATLDSLWPVLANVPSGLALFRFSWTVPDTYLDLALMRVAAVEATRDLAGAKLILDLSETGRLHLYGLGLGTEDELHTATAKWRSVTGAHHEGCRTNPVTGAYHYFNEIHTKGMSTSRVRQRFETNLMRVVAYGFKALPDGCRPQYTVAERVVVASGVFAPVWAEVVRTFALRAPYRPASRKKPALHTTCVVCGKPLPAHRRRHKQVCSEACKQRARRIAYRRRYPRYRPRLITDPALRAELIARLRVHEKFLRTGGAVDVLEQVGSAKSDTEAEAQLSRLVATRVLRLCMADSGSGEVCYELVPASEEVEVEQKPSAAADLGTSLGGTAHPRWDLQRRMLLGDGIPRFPSWDVAGPAITHSPPQLPGDADDRELAWTLLGTFRGAFEAAFDHPPPHNYFTDADHLSRWRGFDTLVAAGQRLRQEGIAPAVWALFSMDVWPRYVRETRRPGLLWVFSPARIEKQTADGGWYCAEADSFSRAIFGPRLRALLHRYERMRVELLATNSEEEVRGVVERHFPGDAYNDMVQRARAETRATQEEIERAIMRGEYVWSDRGDPATVPTEIEGSVG